MRQIRRLLRLAAFIGHCLICLAVVLTLPLHRRYLDRLCAWWYQRLLRILHIRVEQQGEWPDNAVLAVSNHVSWVDIIVYGSTLQPAFISKAEVANWPLVGAIARAIGTLFLPRGAFKTNETSARLAQMLNNNHSVMLFPEATTSREPAPKRFHARLFAAAVDHGFRVLPVAIRYLPENPNDAGHHHAAPWVDDKGIGEHLWGLLDQREIVVRLAICDEIEAQGHDRNSLAGQSHSAIVEALTTA